MDFSYELIKSGNKTKLPHPNHFQRYYILMFPALCVVAVAMAKVVSDVKASDIKVLFVKPLVYWTHFFIIATAFSRPQIDAIGYIHFDF